MTYVMKKKKARTQMCQEKKKWWKTKEMISGKYVNYSMAFGAFPD